MDPDRLAAIPVFADMTPEAQRRMTIFATEESVPAGTPLVTQGHFAYDLVAIEEGEAEVVRDGEQIATLGPGDFFGEIGVLERSLRTATVVATSPMRLIIINHEELRRAPEVVARIRKTLEERKDALTRVS